MCLCVQLGKCAVCSIFQRNIYRSNQHVLPPLISAVDRLARDEVICHSFSHDPECWKAFLVAIVSVIIRLVSFSSLLFISLRADDRALTPQYSLNDTIRDKRSSWSWMLWKCQNVLVVIAEALQCMWIQRCPLPDAWFDHQPFNYHFSGHSGKISDVWHVLCLVCQSYMGLSAKKLNLISSYLNNGLCTS